MDTSIGRIIESLESLARTGWMLRGVPNTIAETVASHLFASALIALEAGFRIKESGVPVDPFRAATIALVHDLGESVIGDIAKVSGIDKSKAEEAAFESLKLSSNIKNLFKEYESSDTIEALVARVSEAAATYLKGCYFRKLGYDVDEIIESMKRTILSYSDKIPVDLIISIVNESVDIEQCKIIK